MENIKFIIPDTTAMKSIISPQLLGFLIDQGYTYCYSHTEIVEADHTQVITLTPVKGKPGRRNTAEGRRLRQRAKTKVQMPCHMDHTKLYLNLDIQLDQRTCLMMSAYGVSIN